MTVRVVIVGAGGHGQVVCDILQRAAEAGEPVTPIGFVDGDEALLGQSILGVAVLGRPDDLPDIPHDAIVVAIGDNRARHRLSDELAARGECFYTARHPRAIVAADAVVEPGAMICAGAIVNTGSWVGAHAILNTACSVDHHNVVGACAHVAPGVHLGGGVQVGDGALIGIGSTVVPRARVGEWAVVAAGAVVTADVAADALVVGVPARVRARESRLVVP